MYTKLLYSFCKLSVMTLFVLHRSSATLGETIHNHKNNDGESLSRNLMEATTTISNDACPYACMRSIIHSRKCHAEYAKCGGYYGWCGGPPPPPPVPLPPPHHYPHYSKVRNCLYFSPIVYNNLVHT